MNLSSVTRGMTVLLTISVISVELWGNCQQVSAKNINAVEEAFASQEAKEQDTQLEEEENIREPENIGKPEDIEESKDTKEPEDIEESKDTKEPEDIEEPKDTKEFENTKKLEDIEKPEDLETQKETEEKNAGKVTNTSEKQKAGKTLENTQKAEKTKKTPESDQEPLTASEAAFQAMLKENPLYGALSNAPEITVYEGASQTSEILHTLPSGYQVTLIGVKAAPEGLWYQIQFAVNDAESIGYVPAGSVVSADSRLSDWLSTYTKQAKSGVTAERATNMAAFPESYRSAIQTLMTAHPNWTFVPMNTGLEWAEVITNEMVNSRNLVDINSTSAWKSKAPEDYNAATGQYVIKNGTSWVQASQEVVSFYMDPRNLLTDTTVFQFEQLTYQKSSHTEKGVERVLKGTFMYKKVLEDRSGGGITYAKAFMQIGKELNISPYFLASRVRQEQGVNGTSRLISGTVPGYVGYYNYFNNKATGVGEEVIISGLTEAMENGWTTRYAALRGGASIVANNYISKGQDTLYLQKFDVDSSYHGLYWHQYMQNLLAADQESKSVRNSYADMGVLNNSFVFKVPVYNNMPAVPQELPGPSFTAPKTTISKNGYISAKLSWNAVKESQGYEIWRTSTNSSGYSLLADVSGMNSKTYEDISIVPGKKYAYKVRAYMNLWGRRKYSSFSSPKTANYTIGAAAFSKASSKNYTSVDLGWKKAVGTGYKIYRKTDNGSFSCIKTIKGSSNISFLDSSLVPGHIYSYKIRTYRTVNGKNYYSSYSPEKKISTKMPKGKLNTASVSEGSSIKIYWSRDNRGNGYQIYRAQKENGPYQRIKTISSNQTVSYKDENISTGITYYYKVRSYSKTEKGNKYSSFSNTAMVSTKLSKPTITAVTSGTSIMLKWKKSGNATGYKIYRADSYGGKYQCIKTLSKNTQISYTDKNVKLGKVYYYKIRAYAKTAKKTGYSSYSAVSCIQPELSESAFVSASKVSTNQAALKWEKIPEADGYKIYRKTGSNGKYQCVKTISNENTIIYKNTGLKKGTKFYYKIRTYKKVNGLTYYSNYSEEWMVQTLK